MIGRHLLSQTVTIQPYLGTTGSGVPVYIEPGLLVKPDDRITLPGDISPRKVITFREVVGGHSAHHSEITTQ